MASGSPPRASEGRPLGLFALDSAPPSPPPFNRAPCVRARTRLLKQLSYFWRRAGWLYEDAARINDQRLLERIAANETTVPRGTPIEDRQEFVQQAFELRYGRAPVAIPQRLDQWVRRRLRARKRAAEREAAGWLQELGERVTPERVGAWTQGARRTGFLPERSRTRAYGSG